MRGQPEPSTGSIGIGPKVGSEKQEPDEWVHDPTPTAPHLYRNTRTGMLKNEAPVPAPKYTNLPYLGPPKTAPDPEVTEVDISCYEAFLDPEFNGLFELL